MKNKFKRSVAAGLLIMISSPLMAGAYSVEQVLAHMEDREKSLKSLRVTFEQQVIFEQTNLKETVQGEAIFAKPQKIKIHKHVPQEQLTVSNGQKMWVYTPEYKQAWVGKVKDMSNKNVLPQGLFPLNNFVADLKKTFAISMQDDYETGLILLNADPLDPKVGYKLEISISPDTWLPVKTIFMSESATITTTLSQVELDLPQSVLNFQFSPPKGTDIIEIN